MNKKIDEILNIKEDNVINKLVKKPRENKNLHHRAFKTNAVHQADLLTLPEDQGFKYVLVVQDTASRLTGLEALRNKKAETVKKAFQSIYKRGPLQVPIMLKIDEGAEFKGVMNKYFKDNNMMIMRGKVGRHKSQALAERMNLIIGKSIMKKVNSNEMNGLNFTPWKKFIPQIEKVYNEYHKDSIKKTNKFYETSSYQLTDFDTELEVGTLVYVPRETPANKEFGNFRAGDIRYYETPKKVVDSLISPNSPIVYRVEGIPNAVYPREELVLASSKDVKAPDEEFYDVEEIRGRKVINGKVHYVVKWKGYRKTTVEPRSILIENPEVEEDIKEFENQRRRKKS